MKTINDLTKELGVSRQTLYSLTKKAGISLDDLTTEKRGKTRLFDEEAEKTIVKALSEVRQKNVKKEADLDNELREARLTIQRQAEELDKLREEAERLRENNDILIRTNATNAITIQTLQAERDQALLTAATTEQRAGWIRRTINKITGKGRKE